MVEYTISSVKGRWQDLLSSWVQHNATAQILLPVINLRIMTNWHNIEGSHDNLSAAFALHRLGNRRELTNRRCKSGLRIASKGLKVLEKAPDKFPPKYAIELHRSLLFGT